MNKNKVKIDALLELSDFSLESQKNILSDLNKLLADSIQDLYEEQSKVEDLGLLEKLIFQVIYHNSSIIKLLEGSIFEVRDRSMSVFDLTAIYSLVRLQIETYINLSYLFFIKSEYSTLLKVVVYKIHGLRKQISLIENLNEKLDSSKVRRELAFELLRLRKIEEYKTSKQKKKFLRPYRARLIKPESIYQYQNIRDLTNNFNLYSNHIHSEYISIRQLTSALKNSTELNESIISTAILLCKITSSVISNLNDFYLLENKSYKAASERLKQIIQIHNRILNQQ